MLKTSQQLEKRRGMMPEIRMRSQNELIDKAQTTRVSKMDEIRIAPALGTRTEDEIRKTLPESVVKRNLPDPLRTPSHTMALGAY
jgi:hypothetical protein